MKKIIPLSNYRKFGALQIREVKVVVKRRGKEFEKVFVEVVDPTIVKKLKEELEYDFSILSAGLAGLVPYNLLDLKGFVWRIIYFTSYLTLPFSFAKTVIDLAKLANVKLGKKDRRLILKELWDEHIQASTEY